MLELESIGRRENLVVCDPVKPSRSNVRRRRMIRPVLAASGQHTPIPNRNYFDHHNERLRLDLQPLFREFGTAA